MPQVDKDVKALLKEHEYLQVVEVGEGDQKRVRIRCDITQHELLPRKDAIESYLKTKKFIKAKEWYCYDYSKYEPYIVEHRRKPKSLFCNVTGTILNRIPEEVEKHVKGKKFLRLKEHVKFTKDGQVVEENDADFDANAFEFENQQLIYSDDEEEDGKPVKKTRGGDDDGEDDEESDDDLAEEDEAVESDEDEDAEDDDMADFYPKEDDEEPEDDHIREAVKRLVVKKRKASSDAASEDEDASEEPASPVKKVKKQKSEAPKASTEKSSKAKASKASKPTHSGKQKKGSK